MLKYLLLSLFFINTTVFAGDICGNMLLKNENLKTSTGQIAQITNISNFGNGNFNINFDFKINEIGTGGGKYLFGYRNSANTTYQFYIYFVNTSKQLFFYDNGLGALASTPLNSIQTGQRYNINYSRNSSILRANLNGIYISQSNNNKNYNSIGNTRIGGYGLNILESNSDFNFEIKNIRMSNIAYVTGNNNFSGLNNKLLNNNDIMFLENFNQIKLFSSNSVYTGGNISNIGCEIATGNIIIGATNNDDIGQKIVDKYTNNGLMNTVILLIIGIFGGISYIIFNFFNKK